MKICYFCKKEIILEEKVGREELCPHCRNDLHCCLNCKFYDEYASNKCKEPQSEWVSERERANFCDFFSFREEKGEEARLKEREKIMTQLEELFRKKIR